MNKPGQMLACLRRIHTALGANGEDLSAWPAAAAKEIEQITDALMERERDARRYRWLRNYRPGLILDMLSGNENPNEQWASTLDAAIDEATRNEPIAELQRAAYGAVKR